MNDMTYAYQYLVNANAVRGQGITKIFSIYTNKTAQNEILDELIDKGELPKLFDYINVWVYSTANGRQVDEFRVPRSLIVV